MVYILKPTQVKNRESEQQLRPSQVQYIGGTLEDDHESVPLIWPHLSLEKTKGPSSGWRYIWGNT